MFTARHRLLLAANPCPSPRSGAQSTARSGTTRRSIALGSFIVAVQFIRAVLEYIDRKTKKMQEGNYLYAMYKAKYCMWYLEKVLDINRNAYILVAVKGYSYCYSAIHAIKSLS